MTYIQYENVEIGLFSGLKYPNNKSSRKRRNQLKRLKNLQYSYQNDIELQDWRPSL